MTENYRIFGSELSPFSVKVRSYFRFKGVPHEWIVRNPSNMDEFKKHAKLPLIPLVITPEDNGMQDSTPIMEKLDALAPEPSTHPDDPALAFISVLLEEYGDEWGNKPMFHYRWHYEADQISTSRFIAKTSMGAASDDEIDKISAMVRERMVPRLSFVGSNPQTQAQIEGAFHRLIGTLNEHLADRQYLMGGRPCFGDFGVWAQLYEMTLDPTPSAIIKTEAPNVWDWIQRMLNPKVEGEFETWESLKLGLMRILEDEVGGLFLPWSRANAKALEAGEDTFTVELEGKSFSQDTQKYHARSLGVLLAKYQGISDKAALDPILQSTGCSLA